MKLLDTTFLIHYWKGTENARGYLEANEEAEFATTTLNIKEIAVGRTSRGSSTDTKSSRRSSGSPSSLSGQNTHSSPGNWKPNYTKTRR